MLSFMEEVCCTWEGRAEAEWFFIYVVIVTIFFGFIYWAILIFL